MPRIARPVILSQQDRDELAQWVKAHTTPQQVSQRCRIVLAAADGHQDKDIADEMEVNFKTVALWRSRFCKEGVDCLWEVAAGRGRKPKYCADKVAAIVDTSLQRRPKGATHWSCRSMAKEHGVSKATVNRIWQSHQIKPALEVAHGKVVGQCYARHRHQEFLKFLKQLDAEFAGTVKLHLVMDNYGTHKHPRVQSWLKRHPRFVAHFIPTSSSWLNLVERWFGELTSKRVRRGVFVSVDDLRAAIEEFLRTWNANPKPFVWTATVGSIVEKLSRCRQTLERIKPGCTRPRVRKTSKNKEK